MFGIIFGFVCGAVIGYVVALDRDPVKARAELAAVEAAVRGALQKAAAWVRRKFGL